MVVYMKPTIPTVKEPHHATCEVTPHNHPTCEPLSRHRFAGTVWYESLLSSYRSSDSDAARFLSRLDQDRRSSK